MLSSQGSQYSYELGDYRMGIEIGRGSFATVYKGVMVRTGTPVAIKSVFRAKLDKRLLDNLESEINILKTVQHPHVVSLLDYLETPSNFYIVMEYCSLGDLSYFVRKKEEISNTLPLVASLFERYPSPSGRGLHETLARHFLKQLVSALQFMRERNLIHRDIKPQNLLLCPPKKSQEYFMEAGYQGQWELPILKVADFGFARILPNTSLAETLCGSPLYMAPEILKLEKYDAKCDLWSVGAVAYEMITGRPPFSTKTASQKVLLEKIKAADDVIEFPRDNHASPEFRSFVRALLKQNSSERMSYVELFNHPLIIGPIETESEPLDQSKLDENLFISEYIQAIPANSLNLGASTKLHNDKPANSNFLPSAKTIVPANTQTSDNTAKHPSHGSFFQKSQWPKTRNSPPPLQSTATAATQSHVTSPTNMTPSPRASLLLNASGSSKGLQRDPAHPSMDQDEYVVVEKRTVEVNALADELAYSPGNARVGLTSTSPIRAALPNSLQRERRMSIGYGTSPTNALARALTMAGARLFGTNVESSGSTTVVSPPQFTQKSIPISIDSDERKLIKQLEGLATKGKVVSIFAEVKFSQLAPVHQPTVIAATGELLRRDSASSGSSVGSNLLCLIDDNGLTLEESQVVAEEALVLYMKTLSLLAKAMDKAAAWWKINDDRGASTRLNEVVQWIRERFNECLERAEYAQTKLDEIRAKQAKRQSLESNELQQTGTTTNSKITAEKLIFDRAMEMSRQAAVDELLNRDLPVCEVSYGTAVWMLEAILEPGEAADSEEFLNEEDKGIVDNFIAQISHRLNVLRKKLESPHSEANIAV